MARSASPLPTVVVGVPYHRGLPAPFVQSLVGLLEQRHRVAVEVRVAYAQAPAVHIARENLLKHFLAQPDADYLVMVDDDQVFVPETVERLVAWRKPMVAPLIVNRLGDPKPVAFRREGTDVHGMVQYRALGDECWAYLAQFRPERLAVPAGVLPQTPDGATASRDVPDAIRQGLVTPLLAVDAVGGGMFCLSREAALRVEPGPDGRYFDWAHGGEDLAFCRRVLESGYGGFNPEGAPGLRGLYGPGIFVDRGCLVGHLTEYARGAVDMGNWLASRAPINDVWNGGGPGVGDLAEALASDGARPSTGPWETEPLPDAVEAAG